VQRANDQEQYYQDIYLKRKPYNQRVSKAGIGRAREKNNELGHDMVYQVVDFNAQRDSTTKDITMIHYPKWKTDEKDKWVSSVDIVVI
jgi:hypothetical protein